MLKPILVVDDDHEMRSLVQSLLESEGYEVDTAGDGQIAWEKLAAQPGTYGVVLLDVSMPRMDGLQLIGALLQHDAHWLRSIILRSADRSASGRSAWCWRTWPSGITLCPLAGSQEGTAQRGGKRNMRKHYERTPRICQYLSQCEDATQAR